MKQVNGLQLSPKAQAQALSSFVHRYTGTHRPAWVTWEPLQFRDDMDWLAHTLFWVRDNGHLAENYRYCDSSPTWPSNDMVPIGGTDPD